MNQLASPLPARDRLLGAALKLVREEGYDSTSVDELCRAAGVTKGAFFHHFPSKEQLAVEATKFWTTVTSAAFESADYRKFEDPLDQLIGYVEFRRDLLKGRSLAEFSCFLGTMVQEKYASSPAIREACLVGIMTHAGSVEEIIAAAKARHAPEASWSPQSLALHTQAVIQGAYVLAKATNDGATADAMIVHLRRYIELLFHHANEE
ncbi:TetR/AcrR family transcriptional regulator [Aestuariivirga litoralis]|uniref:TetR/AcrR family transcriptional regulator n=1 Tax=Aestuariivirga litoralis TaxID=2650924 RepID=UPI0018C4DEED|nr:TetR/AcrR family transcriptional regulator [Aestuariivirga litoralis]MBG1233458.1 TetR/AcrR family transcriptional regulator [Aestuariivirga litoralis]